MGIIDNVYPDGVPVAKANVRADDKAGHRRNVPDVDTVQNNDFSGQTAGLYVRSLQGFFDLDTSDSTTAHNGTTVLVDYAGNRFKIIPAPSGDVAGDTHAASAKATPDDADEIPLVDTAASNILKKLTWANLKAALASTFLSSGLIRERLTANRTYYVASSGGGGSDSNSGLSALAPFLTIQKAIDTVAGLDCSIYDVSISCAAATYAPFVLKSFLGAGKVTITGDTTTPANCIVASTAADGVGGSNVIGRYKIEGFKFTNATSGSHIKIYNTYLELGANDYGAATAAHVWTEQNAYVEFTANYTISGGGTRHLFATTGAVIVCSSRTVTLTGTPAFSTAFIVGSRCSVFNLNLNTYSGSATGARYLLTYNAIADVAGAGASYLPGNSVGATLYGGQYQ